MLYAYRLRKIIGDPQGTSYQVTEIVWFEDIDLSVIFLPEGHYYERAPEHDR